MEVAIGTNGRTPFQREVREWQRIDPNTGALLSGRLEADRWINGPLNTYGKLVDSQNVSQPNGMQHSQRKQLEVLQAHTSSGSMQVIRAQTVQTTSSRWSSSTSTTSSPSPPIGMMTKKSFGNNNDVLRYPALTNGIRHNDHFTNNNNQIKSTNDYQAINNINNGITDKMMTTTTNPSIKLSNLMKSSSNSCNGGNSIVNGNGKISPHNFNNSTLLVQRHQSNSNSNSSNHLNGNNNNHHKQNNDIINATVTNSQQSQLKQPTAIDRNNRVGGNNTNGIGIVVGGVFDYDADAKEHEKNQKNNGNVENDFDLQRGRSVSIDDLTTNWNESNVDDNDESLEWRRVSKIRRSFQFPKSVSPAPKSNILRPIDLPPNSVSVSKICQELENGRRLNTAMRNNHVDLAALDVILNSSDAELSPKSAKKAAFLTAESLKEIRGNLKKLSDESLYKDDFITNGNSSEAEQINTKTNDNDNNLFKQQQQQQQQQDFQFHPKAHQQTKFNQHTTNSLENRTMRRDTSSAEWHLRRKSYGFEKMSPPDNKSMMHRQETSTDSGIGRSGELESCQTPSGGTVITFGNNNPPLTKNSTTIVLNNLRNDMTISQSPLVHRRTREIAADFDSTDIKRHSIAVDETKYVRDNLRKVFDTKTSIHLNGFYPRENQTTDEINHQQQQQQRKRVEFCKTEVHFAADSGRVNIVETDGKPPPTNNFRRRRRTSGNAYLDAISSGVQIMHFGDERKLAATDLIDQETEIPDDIKYNSNSSSNVTVTVPVQNITSKPTENNFVSMKSMLDDLEQDEISLRGILKNKPIKPKPYHLGDNIENSESLWGIKLKPVTGSVNENDSHFLQKNERLLEISTDDTNKVLNKKSVADRIKIVEERKDGSSYSTKINLNLTDTPFTWNSESKTLKSSTVNSIDMVDLPSTNLTSSSHVIYKNEQISNQQKQQALKSTSLIMRQLHRSKPNEIIESQQLNSSKHYNNMNSSSSKILTTSTITNAAKLISNMTAITKSNSANSIFLEQDRIYRPKYCSSLDGDMILNEEITTETKSTNLNNKSIVADEKLQQNLNKPMSVLPEENSKDELNKPIAAPRIKVIGSSSAVNHQLSQLRRMYEREAATTSDNFDSDDSVQADEEVQRFLEGKTNDSNFLTKSNAAIASSDSWSRIKAKKIVQKSQIDVKDVPQSNVMSIKFRSPESTLDRTNRLNDTTAQVPIAKPRTTIKSPEKQSTTTTQQEPLKVVTVPNGGVRKLREHELFYFGVKADTNDSNKSNRINENRPATVSQKSIFNNEENSNIVASKWKLSSDKPDLLRHSPINGIKKASSPSTEIRNLIDEQPSKIIAKLPISVADDVPLYENLQKPIKYKSNRDSEHVEMILNEMNQAANQTLKTIDDRHKSQEQKLQRRLERRPSKPLDTIDEKRSTGTHNGYNLSSMVEKNNSNFQRKCCSRSRSNSASSTCSNSSSNSSNISESRLPLHDDTRRERSRSRERLLHDNSKKLMQQMVKKIKSTQPISSAAVVVRSRPEQRSSSSREHRKIQQHSSAMEHIMPPQKIERKIKRSNHTTINEHPQVEHKIHQRTPPVLQSHDANHQKIIHERLESNSGNVGRRHHHHHKSSSRSNSENRKEPNDYMKVNQSSRLTADPSVERRKSSKMSGESDRHRSERHRNEDRHKIVTSSSSSSKHKSSENYKPKGSSEIKHRTSRSSHHGGLVTTTTSSAATKSSSNPTKTSSSSKLQHRTSKDKLRK